MDVARPRVVVVGGGITGLAAAHRLTVLAPDLAVTLVERDDRLGGKIVTERFDGFVVEGGPDSFLSSKPRGVGLCLELGLADRLRGTNEATRRTFVKHRGRLHQIPEGLTGLVPSRLGPIVRSGLLSPAGKLRFALEYAQPPRRALGDETLAAFVGRRLGGEVYDRLIEPLMGGIYAGDGAQLSLAATFPHLREGELRHGGLIKGVLAAKAGAPIAPPEERRWPPFVAPEAGMGELVEALESRLRAADVQILTGSTVTRLARRGDADAPRYELSCAAGASLPADAVILATPAFVAAKLLAPLDREGADQLLRIPHVSTATVAVAYPLSSFPRPLAGYGYVVPRAEGQRVLACTWTSSKWHHRAPADYGLVRAFVGRAGDEGAAALADPELLALVRAELRDTLGIDAAPTFHRIFRWPRAMPQPTLGHLDRVAAIDARLASLPGLYLAGNAYRGIGIPDCIRSGETAAAHAAAHVADRARFGIVA